MKKVRLAGTSRFKRGAALLMTTALSAMMCTPVMAADAATGPELAQTHATQDFDIPPQPLTSALTAFAQRTGLRLAYGAQLTEGVASPGVRGAMSAEDALKRLLSGTGLTARFSDARTITLEKLAADGAMTLDPVNVEGGIPGQTGGVQALQKDGLAKDGYRSELISSLGPLGQTAIRDTPYSVSVVPRELIENIQAQSPDDVFRVNPVIRTLTPQLSGWSPMVSMRGFTTYDSAEDGMRQSFSRATSLEDKERIEVLTGLSGFLYGAAAPAGMVNYVYKRPTVERLNSMTIGSYGADQKYIHGDFGGRIDTEGQAGYRLNLVKQSGETAIDDQTIDRFLASGAFDWDMTDRLKLELNASYSKYEMENPNSYWAFQNNVPHGNAPDTGKNWSQPWIRDEIDKAHLSGKLTYDVNDILTLRGGYMREYGDRPVQEHTMNSVRAPGQYHQIAIRSGETRSVFDAAQGFADLSFATGFMSHKLTTGYHMYSDRAWQTTYSPNTGWIGPYSQSSPTHTTEPVFPGNSSKPYYAGYVQNHNFVVGDQIKVNEQWSVLAGANYSRVMTKSLGASGVQTTPDYDEGRLSPSASLLFKPMPWMTLYGSYIEGLEKGGTAPDVATNKGQVMAPMISTQREVGIKADVGRVLLTGALFDIEKAFEFTGASGAYSQDGRQKHRGVEITATGKVLDSLTVLGGLTLIDAKVQGGTYDGAEPMNVADTMAKLYTEYEVPGLDGVFLTGGVYHTGRQWANNLNNDQLKAYTTADLGLRYTTEQLGNPLTARLYVSNITGESYWMNSYYLGNPRSVAASLQMKF